MEGHFVLSSGLHSNIYVQCAQLLKQPWDAALVGQAIGAQTEALRPTLVLAPTQGGVIVGHEVARYLNKPFLFAERDGMGKRVLRRGFEVTPEDRVLIVEDVTTSAGSAWESALLVGSQQLIGIAAVLNRNQSKNPFKPYPFFPLLNLPMLAWSADACPLCATEVPIDKPGSR